MRVLNRPMFRKGGSPSQGTGVMSMVEPRKNFQIGTTIENLRNLQTQYGESLRKAYAPSAADKARLVAEIAGTPGTLYDKIMKTLPTQAKIAERQKLVEPELLKQKIAGETDIAKIEAASIQKAGTTEKAYNFTFNRFKQLRDAGIGKYAGKTDSELSDMALSQVASEYRTKTAPGDADRQIVTRYSEALTDLKKKLNQSIIDKDKATYDRLLKQLQGLKNDMEAAGLSDTASKKIFTFDPFPDVLKKTSQIQQEQSRTQFSADGGRIMKADGDVVGEMVETVAQNQNPVQSGTELKSFTYDELRGRLPKEVSNDIVRLLANSQEALTDFAYITTQSDIGNFNQKYGVNLTLPVSA